MAKLENPPFGRGETYYQGGTIDSNNLGGLNLEGMEWEFEDLDLSSGAGVGAKPNRTNKRCRCRVVRNVAAAALLPKRLVSMQKGGTDGKFLEGRVDGYATTTAQIEIYPVDEFLPAAGVPVNDLFWIVIEGPAMVITDIASGAGSVFNVGDVVVGLTAATSGATTSGRVAPQDLTGATALLANQIQNSLGRALSARTTGETSADLLIDVARRW